jgi:hypothetical protein
VAGELQIRIRLVVAKQDVVARRERLDQIILEQQRFGFGPRDRGFNFANARNHHRDARRKQCLREIARHAFSQVARLADVQHVALLVVIAVHARQMRQLSQAFFRVENVGVCHAGMMAGSARLEISKLILLDSSGAWMKHGGVSLAIRRQALSPRQAPDSTVTQP